MWQFSLSAIAGGDGTLQSSGAVCGGEDAGAREEPVDPTHNKMPTIDRIRDEIGKIKGIGEKKQQAVIDAIITILEQEGSRC